MKPQAFSFSRLSRFVNCPKQFHEITVLKRVEDTQSEDGKWGDRAHKMFEQYLKGEAPLTPEFEPYRAYLDGILRVKGVMRVEAEMALDTSLRPCSWFDKDTFVRAIADVLHFQPDDLNPERALVMDHKFGKKKPSKQMVLTALVLFHSHPSLQWVKTGLFWLKAGVRETETFGRGQVMDMWDQFLPDLKQYKQAFIDDVWQPRQSGLCHGWCPVTDCEYWKPKRPTR